MNEHLPECDWAGVDLPEQIIGCICSRLRACAQRVRQQIEDATEAFRESFYEDGYADALETAEKAAAAIPYAKIDGYPFVLRQEALSVIRALQQRRTENGTGMAHNCSGSWASACGCRK